MKFAMGDDEIRVSFNTARDPKSQVRVLAELNAVPVKSMAEKLAALGCSVPELPESWLKAQVQKAKTPPFDEDRARALFAEGKSDLDIAEMLGVSVYQFGEWRRKNGMKRVTGGRAHGTKMAGRTREPQRRNKVPAPEPAPETAVPGSQAPLAMPENQTNVEALGEVLLDLAKRYPGLTLTVNGAAVQALCLNVRVLMNGKDAMSSTLDLEVG